MKNILVHFINAQNARIKVCWFCSIFIRYLCIWTSIWMNYSAIKFENCSIEIGLAQRRWFTERSIERGVMLHNECPTLLRSKINYLFLYFIASWDFILSRKSSRGKFFNLLHIMHCDKNFTTFCFVITLYFNILSNRIIFVIFYLTGESIIFIWFDMIMFSVQTFFKVKNWIIFQFTEFYHAENSKIYKTSIKKFGLNYFFQIHNFLNWLVII